LAHFFPISNWHRQDAIGCLFLKNIAADGTSFSINDQEKFIQYIQDHDFKLLIFRYIQIGPDGEEEIVLHSHRVPLATLNRLLRFDWKTWKWRPKLPPPPHPPRKEPRDPIKDPPGPPPEEPEPPQAATNFYSVLTKKELDSFNGFGIQKPFNFRSNQNFPFYFNSNIFKVGNKQAIIDFDFSGQLYGSFGVPLRPSLFPLANKVANSMGFATKEIHHDLGPQFGKTVNIIFSDGRQFQENGTFLSHGGMDPDITIYKLSGKTLDGKSFSGTLKIFSMFSGQDKIVVSRSYSDGSNIFQEQTAYGILSMPIRNGKKVSQTLKTSLPNGTNITTYHFLKVNNAQGQEEFMKETIFSDGRFIKETYTVVNPTHHTIKVLASDGTITNGSITFDGTIIKVEATSSNGFTAVLTYNVFNDELIMTINDSITISFNSPVFMKVDSTKLDKTLWADFNVSGTTIGSLVNFLSTPGFGAAGTTGSRDQRKPPSVFAPAFEPFREAGVDNISNTTNNFTTNIGTQSGNRPARHHQQSPGRARRDSGDRVTTTQNSLDRTFVRSGANTEN